MFNIPTSARDFRLSFTNYSPTSLIFKKLLTERKSQKCRIKKQTKLTKSTPKTIGFVTYVSCLIIEAVK